LAFSDHQVTEVNSVSPIKNLKSEDFSKILLNVKVCKKRPNYLHHIHSEFHLSTNFAQSWNFYVWLFFVAKVSFSREDRAGNLKAFRYVMLQNFELMFEQTNWS